MSTRKDFASLRFEVSASVTVTVVFPARTAKFILMVLDFPVPCKREGEKRKKQELKTREYWQLERRKSHDPNIIMNVYLDCDIRVLENELVAGGDGDVEEVGRRVRVINSDWNQQDGIGLHSVEVKLLVSDVWHDWTDGEPSDDGARGHAIRVADAKVALFDVHRRGDLRLVGLDADRRPGGCSADDSRGGGRRRRRRAEDDGVVEIKDEDTCVEVGYVWHEAAPIDDDALASEGREAAWCDRVEA